MQLASFPMSFVPWPLPSHPPPKKNLQADFMRDVPEVDIQRIAESSSICHEFFVEPSCTLFRPGETNVHSPTARRFLSSDTRNGWFLVVRGMVRKRIPKKRSNLSTLDFAGARAAAEVQAAASPTRTGEVRKGRRRRTSQK